MEALEPLSKIVISLMDKMEKAMGWIVTPKGKKADQEEAIRSYIKELEKKEGLQPLMRAALITQARKTIKEYCNINDIVQIAIEQMNENAEPEKLDNDWLVYFNEYAKNVNREDAKILWGKVLARECNNCGCIPKKLIHILSVMSKNDAESFEKLCGFMVERNLYAGKKDNIIIIGGNNPDLDNLLKSTKLTHNQITDLDAIGLVKRNAYAYRNTVEGKGDIKKANIVYYYHGRTIKIGNLEHEMPIGFVILTKSGEILADLIEKKELKGYLEYLGRYYVSKGFEVCID